MKNCTIGIWTVLPLDPKDDQLNKIIKELPGATLSITHRCWYLQQNDHAADSIFKTFNKHKVWVDYSALKPDKITVQKVVTIEKKTTNQDSKSPLLSETHLKVLRLIKQKLNLKVYSANTVKTHLQQFKEFQKFYCDTDVTELAEPEINNYRGLKLVGTGTVGALTPMP